MIPNNTIATLGPAGTFSDRVANQFRATLAGDAEILYCSSIKKVFQAVEAGSRYGIVPIENLSEGFIPIVLDLLVVFDLKIVREIIIPITFSCVAGVSELDRVERLYVQFVSRGQCSDFLDSLPEKVEIVTVDSNTDALVRMRADLQPCAAIIPDQFVQAGDFPLLIDNINDYPNNRTRFFVLAGRHTPFPECTSENCKTSVIVVNDDDHPGLLEKILSSFSRRKINLLAITSRPTKEEFGRYHFFIGLAGHRREPQVREALTEIGKVSRVKILGSYERAG